MQVFGVDLTHPPPGADASGSPSVAAIVGSLDRECSRYTSRVLVQQGVGPQGREVVQVRLSYALHG